MTLALDVRPRGPYSLALTARFASDATRRFAGGRLDALLPSRVGCAAAGRNGPARGAERGRARTAALRARARRRPLGARAPLRGRPAARPVAAAPARAARAAGPDRRAVAPPSALRPARHLTRGPRSGAPDPARDDAAGPGRALRAADARGARRPLAAAAAGLGLAERRAAALVRVCRTLDLERLRDVPTEAAATRLERERALGPGRPA